MMRWILLAVLVVAITATATVVVQILPSGATSPEVRYPIPPATSGPRPIAVIEGDPMHTFGIMAQRSDGKHSWTIRNEGKGDLLLTMESSTCSCTIANLKDGKTATVKPGEGTQIELTWNTKENNGRFSQSATIGTNDPERPMFDLSIQGRVQPAVITVPPEGVVDFLEITTDEADHKATMAVFSPDRPDLKITRLITSKPGVILADHEPLSQADCKALDVKAGHKITIHVKSGLPLGDFQQELVIGTDHPKQPEVRITLAGKMVGPITLFPDRVLLHDVSGRQGGKGTLTLLVRGHRETKFQVEKKPPNFQVEIAPAADSGKVGKYRLTVTIPAGTPAGTVDDQIVLKTDHPKASEVVIPVNVYIHDAG